MSLTEWKKPALLFFVTLSIVTATFSFAVLHHDNDQGVSYHLLRHTGEDVTQTDFAGKHQLVFFGFTSCRSICTTQMRKLSRVMVELERSGKAHRVTPMFISVDPERDTTKKVAEYLTHFDSRIVGLTGSRSQLERAAISFKTFLQAAPARLTNEYQITHSSVLYVVDPFNRIVDYIPFETEVDAITIRITNII